MLVLVVVYTPCISAHFCAVLNLQGCKCTICNNYCAQNLKALSAHKRGCSKKQLKIVPNYDLEDF